MAKFKIKLQSNAKTGKRDIVIDYESDADALPHEHEADHRAIIENLLGEGVLDPDEVGVVRVVRGAEEEEHEVELEDRQEASAARSIDVSEQG